MVDVDDARLCSRRTPTRSTSPFLMGEDSASVCIGQLTARVLLATIAAALRSAAGRHERGLRHAKRRPPEERTKRCLAKTPPAGFPPQVPLPPAPFRWTPRARVRERGPARSYRRARDASFGLDSQPERHGPLPASPPQAVGSCLDGPHAFIPRQSAPPRAPGPKIRLRPYARLSGLGAVNRTATDGFVLATTTPTERF
jgi:hypothetical protein